MPMRQSVRITTLFREHEKNAVDALAQMKREHDQALTYERGAPVPLKVAC